MQGVMDAEGSRVQRRRWSSRRKRKRCDIRCHWRVGSGSGGGGGGGNRSTPNREIGKDKEEEGKTFSSIGAGPRHSDDAAFACTR